MHCPSGRRHARLLALLLVAGCARQPSEGMQLPPPQVTVARPFVREVADCAEATGRTEAKETYEVRVRVKGFLKSIKYREGAIVKKGDLLYEIDPRTFEADLESAEAEGGPAGGSAQAEPARGRACGAAPADQSH
jgi:membrane fusion protein, multidrug efflux system